MARFATGKKSVAICDRCGWKIPYLSLRTEWNGLRVCDECFELKHPQLMPRSAFDAQEIYQPRPGENAREDVSVRMQYGVTGTFFMLEGSEQEQPVNWPETGGVAGTFSVGSETGTATITETGVAITSAVGTVTGGVHVSGLAITSALGNESVSKDDGGWNVGTWSQNAWGDGL
jgi:hypothetical protein